LRDWPVLVGAGTWVAGIQRQSAVTTVNGTKKRYELQVPLKGPGVDRERAAIVLRAPIVCSAVFQWFLGLRAFFRTRLRNARRREMGEDFDVKLQKNGS